MAWSNEELTQAHRELEKKQADEAYRLRMAVREIAHAVENGRISGLLEDVERILNHD